MISTRSHQHRNSAKAEQGDPPPFSFQCPECRQLLNVAAGAGGKVRCPVCSNAIVVPQFATRPESAQPTLEWACPLCENPVRLVEELDGRRIRCRECESVLQVSARPWALTIQTAGQRSRPAIVDQNDVQLPVKERGARRNAVKPTVTDSAAGAADQAMAAAQAATAPEAKRLPNSLPKPAPAPLPPPSKKRKAKGESSSGLPLGPSLAISVTIACVVIGMSFTWWTWFHGASGDPRFRYLPQQYDSYTVLNLPELLKSPVFARGTDSLPKPPRLATFESFLNRTGIPLSAVQRITFAGSAKAGVGGVVVYEVSDLLDPVRLVNRAAMQAQSPVEEKVAGKRFFSIGPIAVCFPEPKVLLVGRTELLRSTLEDAGKKEDPGSLQKLISTLDVNKTSVGACAGLPPSDLMRTLMQGTDLAPRIVATVDEASYDEGVCLTRTLVLPDERLATDLARFLGDRAKKILDDYRTGRDMVSLLGLVRVSATQCRVVLQISISAQDIEASFVDFLNRTY